MAALDGARLSCSTSTDRGTNFALLLDMQVCVAPFFVFNCVLLVRPDVDVTSIDDNGPNYDNGPN